MVLQSARSKLLELRSLWESFEAWSLRCADLSSVGEEAAEGDDASNLASLEAAVSEAKKEEEERLSALQQGLLDESRQRSELQKRKERLLNAVSDLDTAMRQLQRVAGRKRRLDAHQIWMKRGRSAGRKGRN